MESFSQDAALLPQWVQLWMNVLVPVSAICILLLLIGSETRRTGVIVLLLFIAGGAGVIGLHAQLGMVRLLGLGHVIFWTPAAWLLWRRVQAQPEPRTLFRIALWLLLVVLVAALVFDYLDVIRWLLGERAPIVGGA